MIALQSTNVFAISIALISSYSCNFKELIVRIYELRTYI